MTVSQCTDTCIGIICALLVSIGVLFLQLLFGVGSRAGLEVLPALGIKNEHMFQ